MNMVVIFGGESVEHDVSVLTGLHLARNIKSRNLVNLVYLTRMGQMVTSQRGGCLADIDFYTSERVAPACFFSKGCLWKHTKFGVKKVCKVDVVINCCHGGAGEDGRLAAFFDVAGIPVTSCPPMAAGELQSKFRTRERLLKNGFPQPKFEVVKDKNASVELKFPLIVKPDTLGSSIGITRVESEEELREALAVAFEYDDVAVVEEFLDGADEINIAVFEYAGKVFASGAERIKKAGKVFDFNTKYLDATSGFVKKTGKTEEEVIENIDKIRDLAMRAYGVFGCKGVVRADFLVCDGVVYLNEMNTVPGFLAYHLWQKIGLPYGSLIEMMGENAAKSGGKVGESGGQNGKSGVKKGFFSDILEKNRSLVT